MVEPDLVTELVTSTEIVFGSGGLGGEPLLPGSAVKVQVAESKSTAQPLQEAGAVPPETELSFHHWAPQNVTWPFAAAFPSPITNMPLVDAPAPPAPIASSSADAASRTGMRCFRKEELLSSCLPPAGRVL